MSALRRLFGPIVDALWPMTSYGRIGIRRRRARYVRHLLRGMR